MTKEQTRERNNYLRREKLKKLKAEGGEEYQCYLETKRATAKRMRDRWKAENGEAYKQRLEKGRKYNKAYRSNNKDRIKIQLKKRKECIRTEGEERLKHYKKMKARQDKRRNIKKHLHKIGIYKERIIDQDIVNVKLYRLFLTLKRIKKEEEHRLRVSKANQAREQMKQDRSQRCHKCHQVKPYEDFYTFRVQRKRIPQICKECDRARTKKKKQDVSRTYIKALILGGRKVLSYDDIPDELVEVKRMHLRIKRELNKA